MLEIDGTFGEGGGQILRTSVALSAVTGIPFRIAGIRAGRRKPGLLRQHLTAVRAAARVCGARLRGAELGSRELVFEPGEVEGGTFEFSIGSAGSATLVLQTILPALAQAGAPSRVVVEGGTHNSMAPSFEFMRDTFAPVFNRTGARLEVALGRHGFYPAGGGRLEALVTPAKLEPFELLERGELLERRMVATLAHLPGHVGEREIESLGALLSWPTEWGSVETVDSPGPGNVLTAQIKSDSLVETFVGFGAKGTPAETIAAAVASEVKRYLAVDAPVGEHLADQLVLVMALAGGGRFRTGAPSRHALTQLEVIPKFLEVDVDAARQDGGVWEIAVTG